MTDACAVTVDGAVRTFGSVRAVDDVSFDVRPGEVMGLLGHNGAGKTTLIRMINGLLPVQAGTIRTLGLDPVRQGERVRARTGVLTEYPALDDFLTPSENIAVYAAMHGIPLAAAGTRARVLLERLGLAAHATVPARNLSAGLKQRLALARALVHDPELLLLDEPTSNLDPLAARDVRDLVLELSRQQGRTVVLSTHNLVEAQSLCDRVAIIQHGHLLAVGSLQQLGGQFDNGLVHFTLSPADIPRAIDVLQQTNASDVAILASGDTVEARVAQIHVPAVVNALVHHGLRIRAIVPQEPTLEDVYVALHGTDSTAGRTAMRT